MNRYLPMIALVVCTAVVSSGCYSTTIIESKPPGAKVVMDQQKYLGRTPIEVTEMAWLWSSHRLRFSREGYSDQMALLSSEFAWGYLIACVCTGGLLLPMVVAAKYPPRLEVKLNKLEAEEAAATPIYETARIDFDESSHPAVK